MADAVRQKAHYSPPWADVSIIGIAGSSGSVKSTLAHAIVSRLNLPWVVILSMVLVSLTLNNQYDLLTPHTGFFLQDFRRGIITAGLLERV
jgi:uridine kinase